MGVSDAPRLAFLGPTRVTRGGEPVALPKSMKARALLAYLAATERSHHRDHLCAMLWDATDDPRGALRWCLSKLRVLSDDDAPRIVTDRDTVAFDAKGAWVDALEVKWAAARGLDALSVDELRALAGTFRGGFLDGVELPDFDAFQAWRVAERARFRELHLRLLGELAARLADRPEEALAPARERVRLCPEDETNRAALVRLLVATGRREEAEEHYALGRKQLERAGVDRGELRQAWRDAMAVPSPAPAAQEADARRQSVRFCTSRDGVRIAYATVGEGPPLVKTANWMNHLEHDWKSPFWRHLARELSRERQLVRYDQRGNGLSDWKVEDFGLEAQVADLEAVVDAAGLARFPLLGISQGCRIAVKYAIAHPDRVSHLVLYGGGARGWKQYDPSARTTRFALQAIMREGWGKDIPAFRQVFTTLFMPSASPEQAAWFNELQRVSTSAENAVRITEANADVDVTELLARVRVPTLVMHTTRDAMVPFEEGRRMASGIPDARFVALDGENHLLLDDEPAFARFLGEMRDFLGEGPSPENRMH